MQQLLDAKNIRDLVIPQLKGIVINPKVWRLCLLYIRLKNMTVFSQFSALYSVFSGKPYLHNKAAHLNSGPMEDFCAEESFMAQCGGEMMRPLKGDILSENPQR